MIESRINAFKQLGVLISNTIEAGEGGMDQLSKAQVNLLLQAKKAGLNNGWFRYDMVMNALGGISNMLDSNTLNEWVSTYTISPGSPKEVGIIMAGNIPAVGFHDLLCVLVSGNKAVVKLSSDDECLIPAIVDLLIEVDDSFTDKVEFLTKPLKKFDAVLATGSNNTARYFEQYFGKFPNIIRKSRTSVAIISGDETEEDISGLAKDLFTYFGLGCRNISKLLVKKGIDIEQLMIELSKHEKTLDHSKYLNNLDYNKSIYIINRVPFLDGGRFLFKEDEGLHSPISVTFFEYYEDDSEVDTFLEKHKNEIQCVIGKKGDGRISFGKAQTPAVHDYADGVDTMEFLLNL